MTRETTRTPTPTCSSKKPSPNVVGEVAGGTAANILVVCCCCPCGLAKCLFTAVYELPVSIARNIWRRRRRRKLTAKMISLNKKLIEEGNCNVNGDNSGTHGDVEDEFEKMKKVSIDGETEEFDRIMWDQFCDTGFWRTFSQRHLSSTSTVVTSNVAA